MGGGDKEITPISILMNGQMLVGGMYKGIEQGSLSVHA